MRDGKVLMMHRRKQPNLGQWTAPGGKVEIDESPAECAVRELREETGLLATGRPELRIIVTETSPLPDWQWLMFVYRVAEFSGELTGCDEGDLAWIDADQVLALDIPQADAIFYPHVVRRQPDAGRDEVRVRQRPAADQLADRMTQIGEVVIRPATAGDAEVIKQTIKAAGLDRTGLDWRRFKLAETGDGELLGMCQVRRYWDTRELGSLWVRKDCRGQRSGRDADPRLSGRGKSAGASGMCRGSPAVLRAARVSSCSGPASAARAALQVGHRRDDGAHASSFASASSSCAGTARSAHQPYWPIRGTNATGDSRSSSKASPFLTTRTRS